MTTFRAKQPVKQYVDFQEQKKNLLEFFLEVNDVDNVSINSALAYHGFYRLKGYIKPFIKNNKPCELDFSKILKIISIDEDVRSLIFRYILMIDFKIAGSMSEVMSKNHGPYWYKKTDLFISDDSVKIQSMDRHRRIIEKINKANHQVPHAHPGASSYYAKYGEDSDLPSWILRECMSFGFWENVFYCLNSDQKNAISNTISFKISSSKRKSLSGSDFLSWFKSLTILRNACAHSALIINKNFSHNPAAATAVLGDSIPFNLPGPNIASRLVVMKFLLRSINDDVSDKFCNEIKIAITKYNESGIDRDVIKKILNIDILENQIFNLN